MEAQRQCERVELEWALWDFDVRNLGRHEQGGRDAGAWSPHRQRAYPSPDRRRGHRGRPGSPPIVQTLVKDVGGGWPMLTKTNYAKWSMVIVAELPEITHFRRHLCTTRH
jgi:hypothetical protein